MLLQSHLKPAPNMNYVGVKDHPDAKREVEDDANIPAGKYARHTNRQETGMTTIAISPSPSLTGYCQRQRDRAVQWDC